MSTVRAGPALRVLQESPYVGYSYSYPHKTAYGALEPPVELGELWGAEDRESLFLYVHIPFCEMRCGFCNLFTTANPSEEIAERYCRVLRRQAEVVKGAIGAAGFARAAVGGGTPTYLSVAQLGRVLEIITGVMGADLKRVPASVEVSPSTADPEKVAMLRDAGFSRVSIGVQSFVDSEVASLGRAQRAAEVEAALGRLRDAGFACLNIDLIYGGRDQTVTSWERSLEAALRWRPEEIYLYPLYVRPLTGLDRQGREWDDHRLELYRAGRDVLIARGYTQISMRMFRASHAPDDTGAPAYCCQQDGMLGLGVGARSYTSGLHYSTEFAVARPEVRAIIERYLAAADDEFGLASWGFRLDEDEKRRRTLLLSLLQADGVSLADFAARFGKTVGHAFPRVEELRERGLAEVLGDRLRLTAAGLERSDAVGPWLYSERVRGLMEGHSWK